jgi:branched-chain amino acid transport system substrate-binding protein
VASINAAGGINGHPVKFVTANDNADSAQALTAVESQVQNDHVIAFVDNQQQATAQAEQTYVQGKQIPIVGGDLNLPVWFASPMYFPTGASLLANNYGQISTAQKAGSTKHAVWYCTDNPTCKIFADVQLGVAKSLNFPTTALQPISLEQASFTAQCLASKNTGATSVTPNVDAGTFQRITQNCASIGYFPTWTTTTNSVNAAFSSLPTGTKTLGVAQQFPFFLTSGSPAIDEYYSFAKHLTSNEMNGGTAQAWAAIQLFEAAAKAGVPAGGTPTSTEILKGLYSLKADTLGGLTIPLTFTQGAPATLPQCWFTEGFSDGKFAAPDGLKTACTSAKLG